MNLDPNGLPVAQGYDLQFDLNLSWLELSNAYHISLAEYGNPAIASEWHVPKYMEIERTYFLFAHIVYNVASVPEPETYAMLLAGLGVIGAVARRRSKRA
ncbi:MAG: FxDxF family PEP-CTERM protein [Azoarcus sp.]|jgi:hypothetical protein|nr:FxDxF family PEP-CTERM protein [Azoarcus sp.]